MHYYDPDNRAPRRWGAVAMLIYLLLVAGALVWGSFGVRGVPERAEQWVEFELVAVPQTDRTAHRPRAHATPAPDEERVAQDSGKEEVTQTPNPKALFHMNRSGADDPSNAGNRQARPGDEERNAGRGTGEQPDGMDQLDKGLQGRGLVGNLPAPAYPGNKSGKIVVRVTVGPAGNVLGAAFEPKGSTENDAQLIEAAIEAARKARFTESRAAVQGGTITYVFKME